MLTADIHETIVMGLSGPPQGRGYTLDRFLIRALFLRVSLETFHQNNRLMCLTDQGIVKQSLGGFFENFGCSQVIIKLHRRYLIGTMSKTRCLYGQQIALPMRRRNRAS